MMDKIIAQTEADPHYRDAIDADRRQHARCDRLGGALGRGAPRRRRDGGLHELGLVGAAHGARAAARFDHRHDAQARDGAALGAGVGRQSGRLRGRHESPG